MQLLLPASVCVTLIDVSLCKSVHFRRTILSRQKLAALMMTVCLQRHTSGIEECCAQSDMNCRLQVC